MQLLIEKIPSQWSLTFGLTNTNSIHDKPSVSMMNNGKLVLACTTTSGILEVKLWTFQKDTPLTLRASLGPANNMIRIDWLGHIVTLSSNATIVDEEWPIGSLFCSDSVCLQYDGKLISGLLVGDAQAYSQTTKPIANPLYRQPQDYLAGDCMPFYDGERYHLYFLKDLHHHQSKWALGAHQYAHISSADLITWVEHPLAISITQQWEGSICTGSVIKKDDLYYAFYAVRMSDKTSARLTYATGTDGIHFTKSEKYFELTYPYEQTSVRDPEVFRDEHGVFHMLVTTDYLAGPSLERNGCLAHLTSDDLTSWTQDAPFIIPGYTDQPECANYFKWNGYYYLIFSNYGVAKYRYSRNPFGPWIEPDHEQLDGWYYRVPKTAEFHNNRRIAAGFISCDVDNTKYGGSVVFRELVQNPNGTLATKLVDELYAGYQTIVAEKDITLSPESFYRFAREEACTYSHDIMVEITLQSVQPSASFGLQLRSDLNPSHGADIRFEPSRHKFGIYPKDASPFVDSDKKAIYGVSNPIGKMVLLIGSDYIDMCVNDRHTLITKEHLETCNSLSVFVKDGSIDMHLVVKAAAALAKV